jgi:predicted nucleic acid-binding protein
LLLDTDVMIDLTRNYPPAVAWLDEIRAQGEKVSLPGFVVMELIQGCRNAGEIRRVEKDVRNYITRWPSRATCKRSLAACARCHLPTRNDHRDRERDRRCGDRIGVLGDRGG